MRAGARASGSDNSTQPRSGIGRDSYRGREASGRLRADTGTLAQGGPIIDRRPKLRRDRHAPRSERNGWMRTGGEQATKSRQSGGEEAAAEPVDARERGSESALAVHQCVPEPPLVLSMESRP